jgi:hypothetical protein
MSVATTLFRLGTGPSGGAAPPPAGPPGEVTADAVGDFDPAGLELGLELGPELGLELGLELAFGLGDAEPVGLALGDAEPVGLALGDGEPVGLVVGDGEPVGLALGDGEPVGLVVGDAEPVGLALGDGEAEVADGDGDAEVADGDGDDAGELEALALAEGEGVTAVASAGSCVPTESPENRTRPATTARRCAKHIWIALSVCCVRVGCDDSRFRIVPGVHPIQTRVTKVTLGDNVAAGASADAWSAACGTRWRGVTCSGACQG